MICPRFWLKHARVKGVLKAYPIYDVPYRQSEQTLSEGEARENSDYFMRVRLDRLAFFRKWLRANFGVVATLDGDGIRAMSRWVDDYGGGLIGDETYTMTIFAEYQPRWEGVYAGYNVMIDIGIFLGEYLISKRPRLHWDIYRGHVEEPATFRSVGYMRPHLGGMPRGGACDVLTSGYGVVATSRNRCVIGRNHYYDEKDVLVRVAKEQLYYSRLPDGNEPIIIRDSKNEPL